MTWARDAALALLATSAPQRWTHTRGVAQRAAGICGMLDETDQPVLVAAAYLHDLGYASALRSTGLHQLDGARAVQACGEHRLAALVAHHSQARFELQLRGGGAELARYVRECSAVSDALTYCDLTTSPAGERISVDDRVRDVIARYGEGEVVTALLRARPFLLEEVRRTEDRLRSGAGPPA
ncbi:MAG: HD domain-containing protein [bacterium]|nr:HD domain-containing protein [bacterium]